LLLFYGNLWRHRQWGKSRHRFEDRAIRIDDPNRIGVFYRDKRFDLIFILVLLECEIIVLNIDVLYRLIESGEQPRVDLREQIRSELKIAQRFKTKKGKCEYKDVPKAESITKG